jgi:ATP-dependent Lon protease
MNSVQLPLFPLPIILFPGTVLPLHIFEPRYRQMVEHVMEGDSRFGLLYHDPDQQGPFLNEGGRVGTVAEIRKRQLLPDGRSMILVRGMGRFQILSEVQGEGLYYEAKVGPYDDEVPDDPEVLIQQRKRSLRLFKSILRTQSHVPDALPRFKLKEELSFRLAAAVRMDPFWQQELLEMRNEGARLLRLDPVFLAGLERGWEAGGEEA